MQVAIYRPVRCVMTRRQAYIMVSTHVMHARYTSVFIEYYTNNLFIFTIRTAMLFCGVLCYHTSNHCAIIKGSFPKEQAYLVRL